MTLSPGDPLPDVSVMTMGTDGPTRVSTKEVLGTGKVVLFGVPGAFTPVCSDYHLPGFVLRADELAAKGVTSIACVSVNDAFVMAAWGDAQGAEPTILMLADAEGSFTSAMGLEVDATPFGLGKRSQRYAAIIEDGVISSLAAEDSFVDHTVSTADGVLAKL